MIGRPTRLKYPPRPLALTGQNGASQGNAASEALGRSRDRSGTRGASAGARYSSGRPISEVGLPRILRTIACRLLGHRWEACWEACCDGAKTCVRCGLSRGWLSNERRQA